MQDAHFLLCQLHLFRVQNIGILQPLVLPGIVEALPLDAGHVQHVQGGHGFLQRGRFRVGNALVFKHIVPDKPGNPQLCRGNQNKFDAFVAAHGLDEGVHRPAIFQIAAQTDGQIVQPPHFPGNGQKIGQGLGGMVVAAVPRVDDGNGGCLGGDVGRALPGVAHGDDVCVAADNFRGVCHAFALGGGGGAGFAEADDAAPQLQHGGLEAQTGSGGGFKKQGRQLFVGAFVPVGLRMVDDVPGGGDEPVQLFHAQVQNADDASHALPPFTAR